MHIVFLGNCQVNSLSAIARRFIAPYEPITIDYVNAYENISPDSYARLARAQTVVAQAGAQPPRLSHDHIPAGIPVHKVPVVSGAFFWPYHGVQHPLNPPMGENPPYTPEYNDRFLAEQIRAGTQPAAALAAYHVHDAATAGRIGRLYDLTLERQKQLDTETGYASADIIEAHIQSEQLFQSAYHFSGRIARHIAALLFTRMGFDEKYSRRITQHLREGPFIPRFVPVHPAIARHFGMRWVTPETRYPFLFEGAFTFDEYVLRFMQVRWSQALQDGIEAARTRQPGAREKLQQGLQEAPNSPEGHHEMSRLVEAAGDLPGAISLQAQAVALDPRAHILLRYADLLQKTGDLQGATDAVRQATMQDPIAPAAWTRLRNLLTRQGRLRAALQAAEKAVEYAPNVPEAEKHRAQLQHRIETKPRPP